MSHVMYMQRCLELAKSGEGSTSPNPLVGSVILHSGQIIGEGWHYKSGQPHAEVIAIRSVKNQELLKESTIYVSLEPCAHVGKTPPCASLIIEKKIPRVVVACLDPNPKVAGKGVAMLRQAGITVEVGVLEEEARFLNRKFITSHTQNRPFVTLKWAQTADGFLDHARAEGQLGQFAISGEVSKVFVHKLRTEHDAILIGSNTALIDNPSLTVRAFAGKNPIRMVLDRQNRLPKSLNLFSDQWPTWRFTTSGQASAGLKRTIVLHESEFLKKVLAYAHQEGMQSILVEGGAAVLEALLRSNLWDEAIVIFAAKKIEKGLAAPRLPINHSAMVTLGADLVKRYANHGISTL